MVPMSISIIDHKRKKNINSQVVVVVVLAEMVSIQFRTEVTNLTSKRATMVSRVRTHFLNSSYSLIGKRFPAFKCIELYKKWSRLDINFGAHCFMILYLILLLDLRERLFILEVYIFKDNIIIFFMFHTYIHTYTHVYICIHTLGCGCSTRATKTWAIMVMPDPS